MTVLAEPRGAASVAPTDEVERHPRVEIFKEFGFEAAHRPPTLT